MSHKILISKIIVLTVISAILVDFFLSVAIVGFKYEPTQNKLKNYFNYGTSTLRKLESHVGEGNNKPHSIAIAGWNQHMPERKLATDTGCEIRATFYGMSFSNRVSQQLAQKNPCVSVRQIAGPGAPLSHSYYMASQYLENDDANYAVLGVLASALPKLTTMAHFNSAFEFPGAHMYPRYAVSENNMLTINPAPAKSLAELKDILKSKSATTELVHTLSQNDAYFDKYVFSYSWMDYSNIGKMLRRSYAQKNKRNIVGELFSDGIFTNHLGLRNTSLALVSSFVHKARAHNQTPIIFLINDKGYVAALDELFVDNLKTNNVTYVSSTDYIDSADLANFLGDGHFTPENDLKLATAIETAILKDY